MPWIKVLLVEDNPMAMEINREFLAEDPDFVCVGEAVNGQEALALIGEAPPDLVLLDNFLPDYNGTALIEKVRSFDKRVDFIMITAAKEVPIVQESFRLGIRDYLIKPYLKDRFLQALRDYKRFFRGLDQMDLCEQRDVDDLAKPSPADAGQPQKGLSALTRDRILAHLAQAGKEVTAEDVARGVGISVVAARRYLNNLAEEKLVRVAQNYGNLGRPSYVYRLFDAGARRS